MDSPELLELIDTIVDCDEASFLEEKLDKLSQRFMLQSEDVQQESSLRILLIQIAKQSVQRKNSQLLLLIIKKLNLAQFELFASSTEKHDCFDIFSLANDLFQFEHEELEEDASEALLQSFSDGKTKTEKSASLVDFELLLKYELDDDYENSVTICRRSEVFEDHLLRIIMKQNLIYSDFSPSEDFDFESFCSTSARLQNFLAQYKTNSSRYADAETIYRKSLSCESTSLRLRSLEPDSLAKEDADLIGTLPPKAQEFINEPGLKKWLNKSRVDFVSSIGASLSCSSRRVLLELASLLASRSRELARARSIILCASSVELVAEQLIGIFGGSAAAVLFSSRFGTTSQLANTTINLLLERDASARSRFRHSKFVTLFETYIKFGLIDEAIQVFCDDSERDDLNIISAIKHVLDLIDLRYSGSLDRIDPELQVSTIRYIRKCAINDSGKDLTSHLVTFVILSLTVYVWKLVASDNQLDNSIRTLETMFEEFSTFSNELNFNSSDVLVQATSGLVVAVKSKLDLFADSEIIRDGFKQLIETIANRCMIESRYKNAAMLYSQIEDNINAARSLMRTGEIDTVINYAILVRDITVNRITINYLKHLGVESKIVDDFIDRSRL